MRRAEFMQKCIVAKCDGKASDQSRNCIKVYGSDLRPGRRLFAKKFYETETLTIARDITKSFGAWWLKPRISFFKNQAERINLRP